MNIAIIGLGLMGGSLALSLRKLDYVTSIVGYDHNEKHTTQAMELGLVDSIASFPEVKKCDVIFLAIPVDGLIATLKELTDVSEDTTIIDLGSTKEKIVSCIPPEIRKKLRSSTPNDRNRKLRSNSSRGSSL